MLPVEQANDDLNLDELGIEPEASPVSEKSAGEAPAQKSSLEKEEEFPDPVFQEEEQPAPKAQAPMPERGEPPTPPLTPPAPQVQAPQVYTAPPPQPAQPTFQFYSRDQLQRAVDEGRITANDMADQLALQQREQLRVDMLNTMQEQQRTQKITQDLSQYDALVPGWRQEGTEANRRAVPEYARLLNMGFPNSDATRLLALEHTFGSIQRIQEARATRVRTNQERQTPPASGRRGGAPPSAQSQKDPLKLVSRGELNEYKQLINKGYYKNWNEVREEIRHGAKQTVNARLHQDSQQLVR